LVDVSEQNLVDKEQTVFYDYLKAFSLACGKTLKMLMLRDVYLSVNIKQLLQATSENLFPALELLDLSKNKGVDIEILACCLEKIALCNRKNFKTVHLQEMNWTNPEQLSFLISYLK
jgi:Leucine-rich repeat (LRR) protein